MKGLKGTNENAESSRKRRKSIRTEIILTLSFVCISLQLVASICMAQGIKNAMYMQKGETLYNATVQNGEKIAEKLGQYETIVKMISKDISIGQFMRKTENLHDFSNVSDDYSDIIKTLNNIIDVDRESMLYTYIAESNPSYFIDNESISVLSYSEYDLKSEDYYSAITENHKVMTEPYVDPQTGVAVVTIAEPVVMDGVVEGLAAVDIKLDEIFMMLNESKLGKTGYYSLISANNILLAHEDTDSVMKNVDEVWSSDELLEKINNTANDGTINIIEFNYKNKDYIGTVAMVGDTGWKILSSIEQSEIMLDVNPIVNGVVASLFLISTMLVFTVFTSINSVVKSVIKVTDVANLLADGDLDVEVNVNSDDEIGSIAIALKKLTSRLKEYIDYIDESKTIIEDMSHNDYTTEFKLEFKGEFAKLKEAILFNRLNMKELVEKLDEITNVITSSASNVNENSQRISQGSTEQASTMEELSAEVNAIADNIELNNKLIKDTEKLFMQTVKDVEIGNTDVQRLAESMGNIEESSNEIRKIIKTIEDIAFQTNILALNASIEAARAGSAGRGFSVVAEEVRNLAAKSTEAAKQTSILIENSIANIKVGTELANITSKSLLNIVEKTEHNKEMVVEIAKVSENQSQSVKEIRDGISQVTNVIHEAAEHAEEGAVVSEELYSQSESLKDLVKTIKIE